MDRREFLRISAVSAASLMTTARGTAGAAGAAGAGGAGTDAAYDLQALAHPELLAMLGPEPVREIGVQYRKLVPAERNRGRLCTAILAQRLPSIAGMVRSDFDAGRTVLLHGWVLSATEARQCALFSLLPA